MAFFVEFLPEFSNFRKKVSAEISSMKKSWTDAFDTKEIEKNAIRIAEALKNGTKQLKDLSFRERATVNAFLAGKGYKGSSSGGGSALGSQNSVLQQMFGAPRNFQGTLYGGKKQTFGYTVEEVLAAKKAMAGGTPVNNQHAASVDKVASAFKRAGDSIKHYGSGLNEVQKTERRYFTTLRSQVVGMIAAYVSFSAAKRLAGSFFHNAVEAEQQNFALTPFFGNKHNVVAARELAVRMGTSGGAPFKQSDMIGGFQSMMESGIDPRRQKNFNTVGNIAGATGQNFSKVAEDIQAGIGGNSGVLRRYGFTNQQIYSLDHFQSQRPDARKNTIMGILSGKKDYKNGMRDFANSWQGMTNKMSNYWEKFTHSVMGDASNKNSLFSKIKGLYQDVLNWFGRNQKRIERIGYFIGEVFKWVVRQMRSFLSWIAGGIEKLLSKTDGSMESFKLKTMKFVLWLELAKNRVVHFFEKWGWAIKAVAQIWLTSKIVSMLTGGLLKITNAFGGATGAAGAFLGKLNLILTAVAAAVLLADSFGKNRTDKAVKDFTGGNTPTSLGKVSISEQMSSLDKGMKGVQLSNIRRLFTPGESMLDPTQTDVGKLAANMYPRLDQAKGIEDQLRNKLYTGGILKENFTIQDVQNAVSNKDLASLLGGQQNLGRVIPGIPTLYLPHSTDPKKYLEQTRQFINAAPNAARQYDEYDSKSAVSDNGVFRGFNMGGINGVGIPNAAGMKPVASGNSNITTINTVNVNGVGIDDAHKLVESIKKVVAEKNKRSGY